MAAYAQPGGKRQKVKEGRAVDNVEYFQGIDKLEYNNMTSPQDCTNYRYYNTSERIHSKNMEDWLKLSLSLTEFRTHGYDTWSKPTNRNWDENIHTLDNYKRCLKAFFELCFKVNIRYWTAFDSDLVPWGEWDEYRSNWEEIVEYIQEMGSKYHMKVLWLAPDLHSHSKYTSGAMTSSDAISFIQAATQIKKCLEVSQRLNSECFLIWPYREGYDIVFQTDIPREMKLLSKLLKMTTDYKDKLNYRCQFLIMPYNGKTTGERYRNYLDFRQNRDYNEMINTYMWDITSCLYFLKSNNLDRHYKVCTPPGHHMYMANVYNMLGGVTVSNDLDHYDTKRITLMMKCIVDQGSAPTAGINLRIHHSRDSDHRELITNIVKYVDAFAKGLRICCGLIANQMFNKHVQQRYASYYNGFGGRIIGSDVTMEECEEYYKKAPHTESNSNKSQHMELMFQRYIDTCDHI